ncbi:unnamed protein product [Linum trigynum]|uniref:RNase H type-1 domain-containing protein n=1 Tax=Linum trigynum TaxID=586398 RepID=A0AAV2FMC2_9ROSI
MGRTRMAPHCTLSQVGWKPPPAGWRKLNVDGAANGSQCIAGAGGVLRDADSSWIGGFVSSLGLCSATMSELWSIYHGLKLAWKLGCRTLIVESDSQLTIQLVNNRMDPLHPYAAPLAAIRLKNAQDWIVNLVHVYREGNRVADWLSKHSLVYPYGMHELETPPNELLSLLQDDLRGTTFARSIVSPTTHP